MVLAEIGEVHSDINKGMEENWGSVVSEIHLKEELADGLKGIDQFTHVLVVFYMHQTQFNIAKDLVRRPRGRADMPETGVFARRARQRPNSIGVTAVKIIQVKDNVLWVKGLDAIDGTPVIDIKPYFPIFDRVNDAAVPKWVDLLLEKYF